LLGGGGGGGGFECKTCTSQACDFFPYHEAETQTAQRKTGETAGWETSMRFRSRPFYTFLYLSFRALSMAHS